MELVSRGPVYAGPVAEEIKMWGRRRLFALARALPFCERVDVRLLGSGLPSMWTARLGAMRLTLALSGWTANDWTRGTNLDQHFAGFEAHPSAVARLAQHLSVVRSAKISELVAATGEAPPVVLGSLHELAKRGQLVYDYAADTYRWRPILEVALTDAMLGPEPPEVVAGRQLAGKVKVVRDEVLPIAKGAAAGTALGTIRRFVVGKVRGDVGGSEVECEAVMDGDGAMSRAKCSCSFFYKFKLRNGPCRHLLALRLAVTRASIAPLPQATVVSRWTN